MSDAECVAITGLARSTYYRHKKRLHDSRGLVIPLSRRPKTRRKATWGEAEVQLVLTIPRSHPTYGKAKIAVILKRDRGTWMSESTVGRILKHLKDKSLIDLSISSPKFKKKRKAPRKHATRWTYGMRAKKAGEMIQIDHMSVFKNGCPIKHFQAWDPSTKYIHANVYHNAKSRSAKHFLLEVIEKMPFPVASVQVDGGSEFMAEFEQACLDLGIKLYVLPPRRPQYNGGVERGNRIFREEFYAKPTLLADTIAAVRFELSKALLIYNTYRPHFSLKGLTPILYASLHYPQVPTLSHSI